MSRLLENEQGKQSNDGFAHTINVSYFALLREQRGCASETVSTHARTPSDLYTALAMAHGFSMPKASLRVAINDRFGSWDTPISEGDKVTFIPPVAGG